MPNIFQTVAPNIIGNSLLRSPQIETFQHLASFANSGRTDREVGIVLPVGCGKSGCITIAPFAFQSSRTLVVAPGVRIATQLAADFNPSLAEMFYLKCGVLAGPPFPEPVEIRGTTTNRSDLDESDVVITNIQQLQGANNRWLSNLPQDFFDLILFDEGHHSVAQTWEDLKNRFPQAKIVNFSATPLRADGQLMAGQVLYSFPVVRAIQEGFVKRLKGVQLNPRTLRYVRREDGLETEVDLAEVKRLGETDADFRRSIVTSEESLGTIMDASIHELRRLRQEAGEPRLKIIASALNYEHCIQIVTAYRSRGLNAEYVHSREDGAANARVMTRLEAHEIDVIVQVRKLNEGFDHKFLAVAAVFSIFSNLSPFVQFVGRIMRVIEQNSPNHLKNQGVVVFHAGANIARQWTDFQQFSEADQNYFDQLLPLEGFDFASTAPHREIVPSEIQPDGVVVRSQSEVELEEMHLLPSVAAAIGLLQAQGLIAADFDPRRQILQAIPMTRVAQRQASREALNIRIRTRAGQILGRHGQNPEGHNLDTRRLGQTNLVVVITALNRRVNNLVQVGAGERHELSSDQLETIENNFESLVIAVEADLFNGN